MTVESITCPNCGAVLTLQPGQNLVTCSYCNSSLRISGGIGANPAIQHAPEPPKPTGGPFQMTVEDVFSIRGRGTIVTGRVASGTLRVGDEIVITRGNKTRKTTVTGIEMFHKILDHASSGDNVGVQLKDVGSNDVQRGDVLSTGGLP